MLTYGVGEKPKERLEQLERQVTTLQDNGGDFERFGNGVNNVPGVTLGNIVEDLSDNNFGILEDDQPVNVPDTSFTDLKHLLKGDDAPDLDELVQFALDEKPDLTKILVAGLRLLKMEKETTMTLERTRRPVSWASGAW